MIYWLCAIRPHIWTFGQINVTWTCTGNVQKIFNNDNSCNNEQIILDQMIEIVNHPKLCAPRGSSLKNQGFNCFLPSLSVCRGSINQNNQIFGETAGCPMCVYFFI